jgi:hypothetical protein
MTYHLRRLRLKGLIQRIAGTHRYEVTDEGLRAALFYTGSFSRIIRPLAPALQADDGELQQRLLEQLRRFLANTCTTAAA